MNRVKNGYKELVLVAVLTEQGFSVREVRKSHCRIVAFNL